MEKQTITHIGNDEEYLKIVLQKKQSFFLFLKKVLDTYSIKNFIAEELEDDELDIDEYIDDLEIYKEKQAKITIFYGLRKIILLVMTDEEGKKKLRKIMDNYCEVLKPLPEEIFYSEKTINN